MATNRFSASFAFIGFAVPKGLWSRRPCRLLLASSEYCVSEAHASERCSGCQSNLPAPAVSCPIWRIWRAFPWLSPRFPLGFRRPAPDPQVALGWLWGRNRLAINRLWGGVDVALGGFARPFRTPHSAFAPRWLCVAILHSAFFLLPSLPSVHHKRPEYNSPFAPASGWSGGTLDKPWTCTGTIEPSQNPVFDQPSLSRPLSCGISAVERFRCGANLWSGVPPSPRLPC